MPKNNKKKHPLQSLFDWVEDREKNETLDLTSYKTLERGQSIMRKGLEVFKKNLMKSSTNLFNSALFKTYYRYVKTDFKKQNRGLKGWRLYDLKSDLRAELSERLGFSLNLIKTQTNSNMSKLEDRFLNWVSLRTQGVGEKVSLKKAIALESESKKAKNHIKFILKDQTNKMTSAFDEIVANKYDAICFIWNTRRDKRVVGNPSGRYPEANKSSKIHGDHYSRQGEYYFYPNSWAIKQGLINKSEVNLTTDLDDGMPGKPIGCRCYAENLYELADVPKKFLSKKGEEYINIH